MAFKFNGVTTVAPYFFEVELIDGDKSGGTQRNANWGLIRERQRARMRKLYFKFHLVSSADAKPLLEAMADESFTCQYPDPYTGALRTATVYVGNRKVGLVTYKSSVPVWGEISFNCIEYKGD